MTNVRMLVWLSMFSAGAIVAACSSSSSGPGGPDGGGVGGRGSGSGGVGGRGSGTGGSSLGAGGVGITPGDIGRTACSDGLDNDADGKIDLVDPECVSPLDDDESSFATGVSGDNMDPCKQDCFFDGNSGMGNDGCNWDLKCDMSNIGATAIKRCEYDPDARCQDQTPKCIDVCQTITPNGCDCFGCCLVTGTSGVPHGVRLSGTCTADKFDDPTACPPCSQTTSCVNDCKPCELCLGKTVLPAECYGGQGGAGGQGGIDCGTYNRCGTDASTCALGQLCVSGCCVPIRIE
jgi:hypothetical protein